MDHGQKLNRRKFMQTALLGGAAGVGPWRLVAHAHPDTDQETRPTVQYRALGRTGVKVSALGFGAMRTSDASVLHHAIDLGINYVDTARSYMGGNNEAMVGTVLKTRRKEVCIATKLSPGTEEEMMASVTTSLKRLQTEVIDVIQLHGVHSRRDVLDDEVRNTLDKMRRKGMVRFLGFSTHRNQIECLAAGVAAKFYDLILVTYNFMSEAALGEAIARAAQAGIGIVAMKTQAGGYRDAGSGGWSPHQAALRWVLQNPHIATAIPSMISFAQVDENARVMGTRFGRRDATILERYAHQHGRHLCRMCGACEGHCPAGISLQDLNRCLMYAEGYGDHDLALRAFQKLSFATALHACDQCRVCRVQCQHGLDLKETLARARDLFEPAIV